MGLDNGICIKRNEKSMEIYDKLKCFEESWDTKHEFDFEIVYWSKCWNVRNKIAEAIGGIYDCGDTSITRDQIPKIINKLQSFNKKNWEDCGGSIWTYDEQKPLIKQQIKDLEYLYQLMDKYDLDIYFYDSY